ncbi:MAG TPA: ferritin-like domain-containing protein [Kofleriaceae bacterium]|nr:ferritin-like domain-containing protein [Kofleriaceae bacterium]
MTAAASDRVRLEWSNRVEAEYRSAALTTNLTHWLIQIGASPDLIADGLRIVTDELEHAKLSHAVYVDAGGTEPPAIDREQLGLPRNAGRPLELDVVSFAVRIFCLGETVAVPLFAHLRTGCTVESARAALDRVLVDEVRHRQFGWDLLDQLLEHPSADVMREQILRDLPRLFADLELSYGAGAIAAASDLITDDDRAWGLAPPDEYAAILHHTFVKEFAPRFAERDLDAGPAWDHRIELIGPDVIN